MSWYLAPQLQISKIGGEIYPNGRSDNGLGSQKARREINNAKRERLHPAIASDSSVPTTPKGATVKLNGQIEFDFIIEATMMLIGVAPSLTDGD